jgi:hypothetical protein
MNTRMSSFRHHQTNAAFVFRTSLKEQYYANLLNVNIKREKDSQIIHPKVLEIADVGKSTRKKIMNELSERLSAVKGNEKNMAMIDYFIEIKHDSDALSSLELALEKDPDNLSIKKKYWLTINDLFISSALRY